VNRLLAVLFLLAAPLVASPLWTPVPQPPLFEPGAGDILIEFWNGQFYAGPIPGPEEWTRMFPGGQPYPEWSPGDLLQLGPEMDSLEDSPPPAPVPEPGAFGLVAAGLLGALVFKSRRHPR
jgi:MYXO-CTERM domain-containing protein